MSQTMTLPSCQDSDQPLSSANPQNENTHFGSTDEETPAETGRQRGERPIMTTQRAFPSQSHIALSVSARLDGQPPCGDDPLF